MYHEVLPIIKGTRLVLKKPLFIKIKKVSEQEKEDKEAFHLEDGGYE